MDFRDALAGIAATHDGVVGVKLRSGEMVILRLEGDLVNWESFKDPFAVYFSGQVALQPWLPADPKSIKLDLEGQVMAVFGPPAELADHYLRAIGARVVQAPSGSPLQLVKG